MVNSGNGGQYKGRVKWFNPTKKYGFICPLNADGTEKVNSDMFVHLNAFTNAGINENEIVEKMLVSYDVEMDRMKGKDSAVNISIIKE
ncbi:Cold shock protein CspA [Candidatus Hepatincolaceae symbiont of Richtersius coronifer]